MPDFGLRAVLIRTLRVVTIDGTTHWLTPGWYRRHDLTPIRGWRLARHRILWGYDGAGGRPVMRRWLYRGRHRTGTPVADITAKVRANPWRLDNRGNLVWYTTIRIPAGAPAPDSVTILPPNGDITIPAPIEPDHV